MCSISCWGCSPSDDHLPKVVSRRRIRDLMTHFAPKGFGSELVMEWMNKIFLKYAVSQRPILLLIDGYKTHLTLLICAKNNQVILLCLPSHTTHALQPLDISVFKSTLLQYNIRVLKHESHLRCGEWIHKME